jgi:Predicted metal-dependent hydrolase of the TIM-barrel fold
MEFTFDTTRAAFNLAYTGALERYPNIRFILAHAGGTVPYLAARFDLLWFQDPALIERAPKGGSAYLHQLFYDTALSANPHALRSLTELVDTDHVLFGSDFPFAPEIATSMQVAGITEYEGYDDHHRSQVERTSALCLLPTVAKRLGTRTTP